MIHRLLSFFLLATCVAAAQTPAAQTSAVSLQSLYGNAVLLQKAGHREEAASGYRQFLAASLGVLAASRAQVKNWSGASALFDDALALTPTAPLLLKNYAAAALDAGDDGRAESAAQTLLRDADGNADSQAFAHRILGLALHKTHRDQEAKKELEAAVALDPSFVDKYNLAVVCLDIDDEKCAVSLFDGIEASSPDTPALHMLIGLAYGNSDFTPRGVAEFKKVLAEDPHYPEAHYCIAASLLAAGADEKTLAQAEKELKEELTVSPTNFLAYASLGKIEVSYRRYDQAERDLKRAIELNPKSPDAYLYLGQMEFDTHRPAEAETNLRKAIQFTTDPARNHYQIQKAYFLLGRILMAQHREQEAHAEMQIAQSFTNRSLANSRSQLLGGPSPVASTASADATANPAALLSAVSQPVDPRAIGKQKAFEKELTPAIADSYNNLGAFVASQGKYAEALTDFQHAATWNPSLDGLDYNLGRAAFMASDFTTAVAPLSRCLRLHPKDSGLRAALAMSQFMTQNYRGCIDALQGVKENIAAIPQMQYIYAESLVKTGQVAPGEARLKALAAAHPEIAEVHRSLGEIAARRGDWLKATDELNQSVQLNANDAEARFDLGKVDLKTGKTGAAIGQLEMAVRLKPEDTGFHRELASAYERAFRVADAAQQRGIAAQIEAAQTNTAPATKTTAPAAAASSGQNAGR